MEILRHRTNAWGQQVLEGVSWELTGVFVVAGLILVFLHAIYVIWRRKIRSKHVADK